MNLKVGDLVRVHWRKGRRADGYSSECFKVGLVVGKSAIDPKWLVVLKWHGNYFDVYGIDEDRLKKLDGWDKVRKIFKLGVMFSRYSTVRFYNEVCKV